MREADADALSASRPLTERLAETPPWSPLRLALVTAGTLFAILVALEAIFGRFALVFGGDGGDDWAREAQINFRLTLVMILLTAYLPAAYTLGVRGARRTLEELRPHFRGDGHAPPRAASVGRFDLHGLRRARWLGVALALAVPFWIDLSLDVWFVWNYPVEPIFQRVLLPALGWFAGSFIYSVSVESRRLSQIGRDQIQVDLLDLRSFAPLTRQGLRYALLVLGLISIVTLLLVDNQKHGIFSVVLIANAVALAAAAAGLLLPLRGAHQAIVTAKRSELDWCDAELRRARIALERDAAPNTARPLADLVAWRGVVAAVPEWPLDAPTLRRFVLYLGLPIGSWLGGAFVERVVDFVLR
jgi:hypothetical protein